MDYSYGGFGSNWRAMRAVLAAKFRPGSEMSQQLLRTGDVFLLEHNEKANRDKVWSDNHDGTGANWLGLQLMLLRDELRELPLGPDNQPLFPSWPWTEWLTSAVDPEFGTPRKAWEAWKEAVRAANKAVRQTLDTTR